MATIVPTTGVPQAVLDLMKKIADVKAAWEAETVSAATAFEALIPAENPEYYATVSYLTLDEFNAITPNPSSTDVYGDWQNLKAGTVEVTKSPDGSLITLTQHMIWGGRVKTNTYTASTLGGAVDIEWRGHFSSSSPFGGGAGYSKPGGTTGSHPLLTLMSGSWIYNTAEEISANDPNIDGGVYWEGKDGRFVFTWNSVLGYWNLVAIADNRQWYKTGTKPNRTWTQGEWYIGVYVTNAIIYPWNLSTGGLGIESPLYPPNSYGINAVTNQLTITRTLEVEEHDFGYKSVSFSLSGVRKDGQQVKSITPTPGGGKSGSGGKSGGGSTGGGWRGGGTNIGGSPVDTRIGSFGNYIVTNTTNGGSVYTTPIEGLNTSTENDLDTTTTLTAPPASFIIQKGSIGEIYPTYQGSLVYDLELKKWGKSKIEFQCLVDYMPINAGLTGQVAASDFEMKMGQLNSLGQIHVYDKYPADSWIRYGKAGYYRLGHTEMLETKVHFRNPANGTIRIDSSMDGRHIDPTLTVSEALNNVREYTFKYKRNGRWFTISLFGTWDLQFMELRGNITGRR